MKRDILRTQMRRVDIIVGTIGSYW